MSIRKFFVEAKFFIVLVLWGLPLLVFAANPTPLPTDTAFQLSVKNASANQVTLHWDIAHGYHLYQDRFHFAFQRKNDAKIGQVSMPAGITKEDNILGKYQVYRKSLDLVLPINQVNNPKLDLLVSYQGCSDNNFCYPPVTKKISVNLSSGEVGEVKHQFQDKITQLLSEGNYFWICLAFVGFGLLLAFTPCVLPMIPILSGIIVGQNRKELNTRKAFFLSLAYVLGMSFAYAVAGVLVALAGSRLSQELQTPWVIAFFSALFVVLALSLFGLFELRLPHFLQHPVMKFSRKQKSGSYIGAAIMGILSVLIVSPCVTAPLVGILTFIAQSGDIFLGSLALFSLGLGMGIPLLIIGTTEGKFMPKSGAWMNLIKSAFGVLLLAVAILLLQRILPGPAVLFLWSVLLIVIATYLTLRKNILSKGAGVMAFCCGVILLVGASMGNSDPLAPLSFAQTKDNNQPGVQFTRVKSLSELNEAITAATQKHQPVMVDFYADWCVSCLEMARTTFADKAVKDALQPFVVLQVDVTKNDAMDQAIQDNFKVVAPPTMLFFDVQGRELSAYRIVGEMDSEDFLAHLAMMKKAKVGV
ncbi:MAG: protein-disulfide reductase DsbD [Gammaproteobacteria bacterium]|nr:protein-disulfide reductase DsbD [Gammaproteobacteria bacterium]